MMAVDSDFYEVFRADHSWWEIRGEDFELADDYQEEAMAWVASGEPFQSDSDESWACTVLSVEEEHTAIRAGDIVVTDGIGSDKIFVRRLTAEQIAECNN